MIKHCECCGNKLEIVFGSTKFCSKCSLYICNLRQENYNLKQRIKIRNKIIERLKKSNAGKKQSYMLT